jgi:hypothetical protein
MLQNVFKQLQGPPELRWVLQLWFFLRLLLQQHKAQQSLCAQDLWVCWLIQLQLLLQQAASTLKAVAVEQVGCQVQCCCPTGCPFFNLQETSSQAAVAVAGRPHGMRYAACCHDTTHLEVS